MLLVLLAMLASGMRNPLMEAIYRLRAGQLGAGAAGRGGPPRFLLYMTGQLRSFEFVAPMNERAITTFQGGADSSFQVFMLAEETFTSAGYGVTKEQIAKLPDHVVSDTLHDPRKNPFLRRATIKLNVRDAPIPRQISSWDFQYDQWKRCHAFAKDALRRQLGAEPAPHTPVIKTRFDAQLVELP